MVNTLSKASMVAKEYASNRHNYINVPEASYLDIAVLIFCEEILIEFLNNFESSSVLKIKHKVYLVTIFGPSYDE